MHHHVVCGVQAIARLISEYVEPRAERDDPLWFRTHILYKEGIDLLLRDHEIKLKRVSPRRRQSKFDMTQTQMNGGSWL
jgi:hypothetical protein